MIYFTMMIKSFKHIIQTGFLVGLVLMVSCTGKLVSGNDSDTTVSDSCQAIEDVRDIDSILKSMEDSLRVRIHRRIKVIEPEIPPYNLVNTDVEGDFADPTTTYHFEFESPLSNSFLKHLKDPSSGWVRTQEKGPTIYEKKNEKIYLPDGIVDYIDILVIIPSKNSGYFRVIDF